MKEPLSHNQITGRAAVEALSIEGLKSRELQAELSASESTAFVCSLEVLVERIWYLIGGSLNNVLQKKKSRYKQLLTVQRGSGAQFQTQLLSWLAT